MNDPISRRAAIDMFQNLAYDDWNQGVSTTWANAFAECADMIESLPSVQPEQKKGHYIGEADGYADGELVYDIWSCSECGCYFEDWDEKPTYNFCPNCGAEMENELV